MPETVASTEPTHFPRRTHLSLNEAPYGFSAARLNCQITALTLWVRDETEPGRLDTSTVLP